MNSGNSKTSDSHGILLNLSNKTKLEGNRKYIALSNLCIYQEKYKKSHTKIINLKYQLHHGMKSLNYLTDCILYQIFKIILNISYKKRETVTDNLSLIIYVNKIEIVLRLK